MHAEIGQSAPIRTPVPVRAEVALNGLSPDEVRVQLYHGAVTSMGDLTDAVATDMRHDAGASPSREGLTVFEGSFAAERSGQRGFTVRIVPREPRMVGTKIPALVTWYRGAAPSLEKGSGARRPVGAGA